MIPILYDTNETDFSSNGLGRLRDCISCVVTEERNGVYECDFEYPVTGANYDQIRVGRIVGVTHDDSITKNTIRTLEPITDEADDNLTDENSMTFTAAVDMTVSEYDIQPFDIVSFTRPINGVVTFHCVHISYRQSYMTVTGTNINSIADAFTLLASAEPTNPFSYETDKTGLGYMSAADGVPKSVRSMLGGVEGSILDTYGGEYEWDRFKVILHENRGVVRPFSIRYGVNMLDYNEEYDSQGTYSSCVPYWTYGTTTIVGDRQDSSGMTVTGRGECVPLDVSDKFESQPTKADVEAMGLSLMGTRNPMIPHQNIHVEFVRLQDMGYEWLSDLYKCKLCDTIKVVFPDYNATGQFKIVKTVWNVLANRYESMELGDLSVTLAEALGISNTGDRTSDMTDFVVEQGTSNGSYYRKWNNGTAECWINTTENVALNTAYGSLYQGTWTWNFPLTFTAAPTVTCSHFKWGTGASWATISSSTTTSADIRGIDAYSRSSGSTAIAAYAIGKWK